MSHYYALVVIPAEGDVEDLVSEAMAPHDENEHDNGIWDWWQIGGRYTGRLSGYDPTEDPQNIETCNLCHGSGFRNDEIGRQYRATNPDYTCNGCRGEGKRPCWPTDFVDHDGDVAQVENAAQFASRLDDRQVPFAILAHESEGKPILIEEWTGEDFVTTNDEQSMRTKLGTILVARERAGLGSRVVVVDYHC